MRSTLIALAIAGALTAGSAAAGTVTVQGSRDVSSAAFVMVQYGGDRWDDRSASINERESRIRARIERGLHDGRLTNREANRLHRELASIEAKERTYRADGRLNYRENAELNRNLDRLADNMRAQLRDDERNYTYAR